MSICTEAMMHTFVTAYGRTARPEPPYNLHFPETLLAHATQHLQRNGRRGHEQVVLWGGYATSEGIVLASLFLPDTESTWGWVHILPAEQPKITEWLRDHGQLLFVEAHTHGSGSRATELSDEDRRHPAGRQNGFLTLIVPDYARYGIDFSRVGVWECQLLHWRRLTLDQVNSRFHVVSEAEAHHVLG